MKIYLKSIFTIFIIVTLYVCVIFYSYLKQFYAFNWKTIIIVKVLSSHRIIFQLKCFHFKSLDYSVGKCQNTIENDNKCRLIDLQHILINVYGTYIYKNSMNLVCQ